MAPLAWLMGIPWSEAAQAGRLLGIKTVLNEFMAYLELAQMPADALEDRSRIIMTYALCGFANIGSLGIMIAGLGEMAPARRTEVLRLGPRSVLAGTLTTLCTGAVVSLLL
jgi:CNT family concentrative nucleoside transporter